MRGLIVTFFLILSSGAVVAQDCQIIETDRDRLACYDAANGRTANTQNPPPSSGNWRIHEERSEFKDTSDHYLSVTSDTPLACSKFNGAQQATLHVRCKQNTTSLFVATNCHLTSGHGGYGDVEYRVDEKESRTKAFDASTDNEALGLWSGGQSIPTIKELLGGRKLLVRFVPFNNSPVTTSFDISGIDEAIVPLREACGW